MADPLHFGTVQLNKDEIPTLTNGKEIFEKLQSIAEKGGQITEQIYGNEETMTLFGKVFPEIVEFNDIGKIHSTSARAMWAKNGNVIEIEVDDATKQVDEGEKKNVYIGGPAAIFAAFIEAKARQENPEEKRPELLYYHSGCRGLSNWKGSASYFHIRDAVPVFYWPDNTGIYVFINTLRHGLQKRIMPKQYYKQVYGDPDFNMLRLKYWSLINELDALPVFIKNTYLMMRDVGLHVTPSLRILPPMSSNPQNAIAYVTLQHSALSRLIFDHYQQTMNRSMLINSSEQTRALHLELLPGEKGKISFIALKKFNQEFIPFRELPEEERASRGYTDAVHQALEFPVDGYLPPYLDQDLEDEIIKAKGEVSGTKKLTKVLVRPKDDNDLLVSNVVLEDTETRKKEQVAINELFISLGPSARTILVKKPNYTLLQHARDIVLGSISDKYKRDSYVYPATFKSLLRHVVNDVEGVFSRNNIQNKIIWASGGTSVLLIKIDPEKVSVDKLAKFRDHIDKHNRHFVRLGEKRVIREDGKEFIFFATQVVGGGTFPCLSVHPETVLNAIKANAVRIYGLEDVGVEYDIVQVRSCARAVTGQNSFRFSAPFANMIQIYGVGGIGMATMAPNGLMMKALMKTRKLLSSGAITESEFYRRLKCGDFGDIPDFGKNIFDRNYAQFTDNPASPLKMTTFIRRKLGVEDSLSAMEYAVMASSAAAAVGCGFLLRRRGFRFRSPRKIVAGVRQFLL